MSILRKTWLTAVLVAAISGSAGWAQQLNTEQVIDRIVQRENDEVKMLSQYDPIIETYVQDINPDQQPGALPVTDHYFLGNAILSQGTVQRPASGKKKTKHAEVKLGGLKESFDKDSTADGFLHLIYLDPNGFDRKNYRFDYVRREFLGEVRCFVFDVTPLEKKAGERFLGRIWVEDQGYTIIRFNGANSRGEKQNRFRLHFDSWRVNRSPGVWVPAYIYSVGSDAPESHLSHVVFQAETRFWGYRPVEESDRSLAENIRAQERETEEGAVDRLEAARLLAPKGGVDKILSTVVNNLEVSNNLDIEPDVECRVLLTSTLESFPIGHTIVVSRGLLDVLPDESSLAMVLAHEMGHIVSGHSLGDEWALRDWSSFFFEDASFDQFAFPIDPRVEDAANAKALELLGKSPYKDKMTNTTFFLQAIDSHKKNLPNFISAHVASLVPLAPQKTAATQGNQIAALPMGSRVDLDPWTDQVEITKRKPGASTSKREGQPFQINPTIPYLVRNSAPAAPDQNKPTAKSENQATE